MAPDLNSVPLSPRPLASSPRLTATSSTASSRRPSQHQMSPPTLPLSSPAMHNSASSNQSILTQLLPSPGMPLPISPGLVGGDDTGVGHGPGPLRHPRAQTAADIYLWHETEQEAMVNRFTRALSTRRPSHNASVASNSSSTSGTSHGFPDQTDHSSNHLLSGASHPVPSTRPPHHQRSSSSTSARSISASVTDHDITSVAPEREQRMHPRQSMSRHDSNTAAGQQGIRDGLSRQNSHTSSRRSGASSPAPDSYFGHSITSAARDPLAPVPMNRQRSSSSATSHSMVVNTDGPASGLGSAAHLGSLGHEERSWFEQERAAANKQIEELRQKVVALERELYKVKRDNDVTGANRAARSESDLSNVSLNADPGRSRDKVDEESVSADNTGAVSKDQVSKEGVARAAEPGHLPTA